MFNKLKFYQRLAYGFLFSFLLLVVVFLFLMIGTQNILQKSIENNLEVLTSQTMNNIDRSIYGRIEEIQARTQAVAFRQKVLKFNSDFDSIDNVQQYINEKDVEWASVELEEVTPFMQELMDNDVAKTLHSIVNFYEERYYYKLYNDISVTNKHGANIAQTEKTLDYYQADEDWWKKAKEQGVYMEGINYDQSTGTYVINICIRINDDDGNFIGVMRAGLNAVNIIESMEMFAFKKDQVAEIAIKQKANTTARQLEDYLTEHPEMTIKE